MPADPPAATHGAHALVRGLTTRHIQFIALGTAIGTGLFYGSAGSIQMTGPSVLLAYLVAGLAAFMVMRAMGEMALRDPDAVGSFSAYARRHLGPTAGFTSGWLYVMVMLVVAIADVTALADYLARWWPAVPGWVWIAGALTLVTLLNVIHVKVFGEMEFWLSLIKVSALIAMIIAGVAIMAFHLGAAGRTAGIHNLWSDGGFFPRGAGGFLMSFTIVAFAFGGIETLGLAAAEAQNPERSIPRAINTIPWRILLFYIGAVGVVLCLAPWSTIDGEQSAFVQIFETIGLPAAADVFNVVVITAAFSALNAVTFALGRILHGLAEHGDAPRSFARTSHRGVPAVAVLMVAAALVVGLVLNVLIPQNVFIIIASIASFGIVAVWLIILLSHMAMKRRISRGELQQGPFPTPGWPVASWLAAAFLVLVLVLFAFSDASRPALWVGGGVTVALVLTSRLLPRRRFPGAAQ